MYYGTEGTYNFTNLKEGHKYQISVFLLANMNTPEISDTPANLRSEWTNMTVTTPCSDLNCVGSPSASTGGSPSTSTGESSNSGSPSTNTSPSTGESPSTGGVGLLVAPVALVTGLLMLIIVF